jgi:hypothetical protein
MTAKRRGAFLFADRQVSPLSPSSDGIQSDPITVLSKVLSAGRDFFPYLSRKASFETGWSLRK